MMNHDVIDRRSFDEIVSVNEIMQAQIMALEADKMQMALEYQRFKRRINDIHSALEDLALDIQDVLPILKVGAK